MSKNLNILGSGNPLPPAISLTPALQNRLRSGTLPSSYLTPFSALLPLINPNEHLEHLGLHTVNDPLGLHPGENSNLNNLNSAVDIPQLHQLQGSIAPVGGAGAGAGRRMRSGSLFLLNSIWNDDNVSGSPNLVDNASIHSASLGSFLSPMLSAQLGQQSLAQVLQFPALTSSLGPTGSHNASQLSLAPRNRSYTTSGTMLATPLIYGLDQTSNRVLQNSYISNDINMIFDPMYVQNGSRVRARTLTGAEMDALPLPDLGSLGMNSSNLGSVGSVGSVGSMGSVGPGGASSGPVSMAKGNPGTNSSYSFLGTNSLALLVGIVPELQIPLFQEDFDFSKLNITTNFDNPNLGPTKYILFDNLPKFMNLFNLWQFVTQSLHSNRGNTSSGIVSIKCTSSSQLNLAMMECINTETAMQIKANFNHMEIVPGVIVYVAFALVEENKQTSPKGNSVASNPNVSTGAGSTFADVQMGSHNVNQGPQGPQTTSNQISSAPSNNNTNNGNNSKANRSNSLSTREKPVPTDILAIKDSLLVIVSALQSRNIDVKKIGSMLTKCAGYQHSNYQDNFGLLPDPIPLREFDSPKLRDLRKVLELEEQLDQNDETVEHFITQTDLEQLCLVMLDELPELCYDYLGNTIVQKIFSLVQSPLIKLMMVKEIAPYLTQLGIHKNGTWAIQKIINLCHHDSQQMYLIGASLKPYSVKLFNDQFGNYVLQGCLKFGTPFNDFIFEAILDNFLEISFGRFGSRSIRTILENADSVFYILEEQFLMVAGLIVQFANDLVVNSNGSLLITWFLDSFNSGGNDRYKLISGKFLPHLNELCCHKLANLTILKILNNRNDISVKEAIMGEIFGKFDEFDEELSPVPSLLLENILSEKNDNTSGPVFIFKILSNASLLSFGEDKETKNTKYLNFIFLQVRRILLEMNINNIQPYKKLMDEVGLSSSRLSTSSITAGNGGGNGGGGSGGRRSKRGGRNGRGHGPQNGVNGVGNITGQNNKHTLGSHRNHGNHMGNFMIDSNQYGKQQYGNLYQYPGMVNQQNGNFGGGGDFFGQVGNDFGMMARSQPLGLQVETFPLMAGQYESQYGEMNGKGTVNGNGQYMPAFRGQHEQQQMQQQDQLVMRQLEELSLSSAAMGYNSNPQTPTLRSSQKTQFI